MPNDLEVRMVPQVSNIVLRASEKIVNTQDFVLFLKQTFTQVRPEESSATSDQNTPSIMSHVFFPAVSSRTVSPIQPVPH
jgi:hypothetical protein